MPVITNDITVRGFNRESVFEWLGKPSNHERILKGAFDEIRTLDKGIYELFVALPGYRSALGYELRGTEDDHGGRRVLVDITGRRMGGVLHYSMSTQKGTTNTVVTLHFDYSPDGLVGKLLDSTMLRPRLERSWTRVLENLRREIESEKP